MCVVSMVHDFYSPKLPEWTIIPQSVTVFGNSNMYSQFTQEEMADLRKLIADFRAARDAALVVDKLTGQPDCVDPEKERLMKRVEELEKQLSAIKEVIR